MDAACYSAGYPQHGNRDVLGDGDDLFVSVVVLNGIPTDEEAISYLWENFSFGLFISFIFNLRLVNQFTMLWTIWKI